MASVSPASNPPLQPRDQPKADAGPPGFSLERLFVSECGSRPGSWLRWGKQHPKSKSVEMGANRMSQGGSLAAGLRRGREQHFTRLHQHAPILLLLAPPRRRARARCVVSAHTEGRGKDMRDLRFALVRVSENKHCIVATTQLLLCRRRSQRLGPGLLRVRGHHASHCPRQQDFVPPRVRREIRVRSMCLFRGCDH
jgi:hypothetical protein